MVEDLELHEANLKDDLLRFLIANKPKSFNSRTLKKELYQTEDLKVIDFLISKITSTPDPIIDFDDEATYDMIIKANAITEMFIKTGGFTAIYEKKKAAIEKAARMEEKREKQIDLDLIIKESDVKHIAVKIFNSYWYMILALIAISNVIIEGIKYLVVNYVLD